jgi:hypothetical protein
MEKMVIRKIWAMVFESLFEECNSLLQELEVIPRPMLSRCWILYQAGYLASSVRDARRDHGPIE